MNLRLKLYLRVEQYDYKTEDLKKLIQKYQRCSRKPYQILMKKYQNDGCFVHIKTLCRS